MRPERLRGLVVAAGCATFGVVACSSAQPDFGTLPVVKVPFGDPGKSSEVPPRVEAGEEKASSKPSIDLPDPAPLRVSSQFDFVVLFDKGSVSVLSASAVELKLPVPSERRLGRYAFELWRGAVLVERVRFDFPLLGAGDSGGESEFEAGLTTQVQVRVPQSDRASSARILDRKTRVVVKVDWPPTTKDLQNAPNLGTKETKIMPRASGDE